MKKMLVTLSLAATAAMAQVSKGENIEVPYVPYEVKMGKNFVDVQAQCLSCHSFGYIINQGPQSRKFWRGKVDKMIKHFKAPMDKKAADMVVNYLAEYYGNGQ